MCQTVPPPPPDIDVDQPPGSGEQDAVCKYDRYAQHRDQSTSCAGCHSSFDPIGFGLENYNIAGQYRDTDDGLPECVIEGEGEISGIGTFSGPAELAQLLVDNNYVDRCAVQQFMTYAMGRAPNDLEAELMNDEIDAFRAGQKDFKAFMLDYIATDRFGRRAQERL